ncbi:MAG: MFS transporter, partial [Pseudomonadota bacterium]|nr:MFS transporter [Pseudomonadota bacterium]
MNEATISAPSDWRRHLPEAIRPYTQQGPVAAFFLGISSGLPFTLLAATLTQRLSEGGIERKTISAFAFVLLIYSIKWAWAPVVDRVHLPFSKSFGQRRTWLVLCAVLVVLGIILLARADPSEGVQKVLLAALVLGFAGATYDIVIDAYRIELLEPEQLGTGSGMSQYGWRIGAFLAGTIALAGAASIDWTFGYIACAPLALSAVLVSLVAGEPRRHKEREWPRRASAGSYRKLLVAIPVILLAASGLDYLLDSNILFRIAIFGLIYPLADLTIRRAHDAGWSGHLAWLLLAPVAAATIGNLMLFWVALGVVGALVLALALKPGDAAANRFGDAPAALAERDVVGPMVEFFRRKGAWLVFVFVLVHKIGDTMANLMVRDLFVTEGFSKEEILFADVWVGFICLL